MNKNKLNYTILGVIILGILFLFFYFYWPIVNERYVSPPAVLNIPNTNTVIIEPEEKISPYDNLKKVIIPKLGQEAVLILPEKDFISDKNDFVENNLDNGVVMYPNSIEDLKKENLALFGHSSSIHPRAEYALVFVNLDKLALDDEIILMDKNDEQIKYKVNQEPKIIESDASEIVGKNQGEGIITLVTCWPPGTTQKRIYVTGQLAE
ncbi:MAG: sortase [Patescibacteria group bacterium]|nr:sortase [Patescibacteria group bacterium]